MHLWLKQEQGDRWQFQAKAAGKTPSAVQGTEWDEFYKCQHCPQAGKADRQ